MFAFFQPLLRSIKSRPACSNRGVCFLRFCPFLSSGPCGTLHLSLKHLQVVPSFLSNGELADGCLTHGARVANVKRSPQVGGFVLALVVFKRGAGRLLLLFGLSERLLSLLGGVFGPGQLSTGSLKFSPDSFFRLSRLLQFSVQAFGFSDQLALLPFIFFCPFEFVF